MRLPPLRLHRSGVVVSAPSLTRASCAWACVWACVRGGDRTLFVLWIVFLLGAAYCEMVVPSSVGIKAHPLFCMRPSWWRRTCKRRQNVSATLHQSATVRTLPHDVAAERQAVWSGSKTADAIRLLDLRVVYVKQRTTRCLCDSRGSSHVLWCHSS